MEQLLVDVTLILDSTIRLAVPLILACLAGLYSERAGIVDIGLEGKLLAGAFAAASMSAVTGSAWLGLLAGIGAALMFSGIHGLASINLKGNQTISGVALNFLAAGLTTFLGQSWFKRGGYTPQLSGRSALQPDHAAIRRPGQGCARARPDLLGADLGPQHHHLLRLHRRAGHRLGTVPHALRPAGCAPSARTPRRSTRPAFR